MNFTVHYHKLTFYKPADGKISFSLWIWGCNWMCKGTKCTLSRVCMYCTNLNHLDQWLNAWLLSVCVFSGHVQGAVPSWPHRTLTVRQRHADQEPQRFGSTQRRREDAQQQWLILAHLALHTPHTPITSTQTYTGKQTHSHTDLRPVCPHIWLVRGRTTGMCSST